MPKHIPITGVPPLASSNKVSLIGVKFLEAVEKSPTPGKIMASACLSCAFESPTEVVKPTFPNAHLRL
jgi:hypothetical protein